MSKSIRDILLEAKEYIEKMEVKIDGEWGIGRTLWELQNEGYMPNLYNRVIEALNGQSDQTLPTEGAAKNS